MSFTTFAQTTENCPDTAPSRLTIGEQGRVLPGNPNNVREQPSRESLIIGKIPAEAVFIVLDGPTCADGVSWWQIDYEGLIGWTAEAVGFEYAVESLAPYTTDVEFAGVSFTLPSEIAIGYQPDILPTDGVVPVPVPMPLPTRIEIAFEYADSSVGYANVRVMPVVEFNAMYPDLLDAVAEQLETRPEVPTLSDVIPFHPGNRVLFAHPAYVEFEGGAGIRAVSASTFSVDPIDGYMTYLFVGLTDNGRHVVLIKTSVSSAAVDAVEFDPENFETYLEDFQAVVETIPADEFTPSLTLIDEMVSTLQIAPDTLADAIAAANAPDVVCKVTPIADTNVRVSPDVNAEVSGYAAANTEYSADLMHVTAGEQFPWWHLADDADVLPLGPGLPTSGRWLRADFVKESGDCDNLPQQ